VADRVREDFRLQLQIALPSSELANAFDEIEKIFKDLQEKNAELHARIRVLEEKLKDKNKA